MWHTGTGGAHWRALTFATGAHNFVGPGVRFCWIELPPEACGVHLPVMHSEILKNILKFYTVRVYFRNIYSPQLRIS